MGVIIAGITGPKFGTVDQASIYLANIRERDTGGKAELSNGQGDIVNAVWFGSKGEFSMDYKILSSTVHDATYLRGHTFVISADSEFPGTYFVDDVEKSRQEGQWLAGSLNATRYDASGFTTTTMTTTTTTT